MVIREIAPADMGAVAALLAEGLDGLDRDQWLRALSMIAARPRVADYPQLGFVLEVDGDYQGVILLLTSVVDGTIRSNLSSWYVRPDYRKYATFLYQRSIKIKGGVYLNLSPSSEALPIAAAFGFKPYSAGALRFDARWAFSGGQGRVRALGPGAMASLSAEQRATVEAHLGYGCAGFVLEDAHGAMPALYRVTKTRKIIPTARFVAGDVYRLTNALSAVARHLLFKGIPLALMDAPLDWSARPSIAHMADKNVRYAKGGPVPVVGDLRETEMAMYFR